MGAILWAPALLAPSSTAVEAAVLTVANSNNSGPQSLRAAVAASAADTITFGPAVKSPIVLTSAQIPIARALTITGPEPHGFLQEAQGCP